jgi:hypothetical protein
MTQKDTTFEIEIRDEEEEEKEVKL